MTIQLTKKQQEAVEICLKRYKDKAPYTVVAGYAGTGKSTVIKFVVDALGLKKEDVRYVTFTGKAAQVLRAKGHNATTIHKYIYRAFLNSQGKFVYSKLPKEEVTGKIIIVDEISMVPANLLRDLASYKIPMILLGDPGQLPPVGEDNGMLKNPHVFLDEVMRQALDNSIIRLSMLIREGKPIPKIDDEYVKVFSRSELNLGMVEWADQVICGRNDTRKMINNIVRQARGFTSPFPQVGDKMICTRNDWEFTNGEEMPIVNGTIGTITDVKRIGDFPLDQPLKRTQTGIIVDFTPDFTGTFENVNMDPNLVRGYDSVLQQQIQAGMRKPESIYQELEYGYAITCHKSQGSEFKKVLVIEEVLNSAHHRRWLYTAVTRASEKLVLITKD